MLSTSKYLSHSFLKYLDFPFVSSVTVQDKPSLLAGKLHAILCRQYIKGRDWYDFIWYTSQNIGINFEFLTSAINQQGPWQNQNIKIDGRWILTELENKIISLDWGRAKEDVRPMKTCLQGLKQTLSAAIYTNVKSEGPTPLIRL